MTIKLHVFPLSPRAFKVLLAANHLGIDYAKTFVKDFNGRPTPIVDHGRAIPELTS